MPANSSKQTARATPKGLRSLQRSAGPFASHSLCLLCAAPIHENTGFCGQTVSKSTSVHEIVGSGGQDIKPPGFYAEPKLTLSPLLLVTIYEKRMTNTY